MPTFETYLKEAAEGVMKQVPHPDFDEGVIGNFMAARFIRQANLPGFLPAFVPSLRYKPCTSVEGACGSGGLAVFNGVRSVLSGLADSVYVCGFEIQNTMKAVYGADILAGAAYHAQERKTGQAHFFPGIFSERAGAYYEKYGYDTTRKAMAMWYEYSIKNARKNPKAQEYQNTTEDLLALGMLKPSPDIFVPCLNLFDCSKVSDGASALVVASEEGLAKLGIKKENAVEIIGIGGAEGEITNKPKDLTVLDTTVEAGKKAFTMAGITKDDLSFLELHDCFTITGLLALEALGFSDKGRGAYFVLEGNIGIATSLAVNLSGGLGGFGHPTGATGVRQMVDLYEQLTSIAPNQGKIKTPYGMMVSMGGNDKTVTAFIVKKS